MDGEEQTLVETVRELAKLDGGYGQEVGEALAEVLAGFEFGEALAGFGLALGALGILAAIKERSGSVDHTLTPVLVSVLEAAGDPVQVYSVLGAGITRFAAKVRGAQPEPELPIPAEVLEQITAAVSAAVGDKFEVRTECNCPKCQRRRRAAVN